MKKALPFALSTGLVSGVVFLFWLGDVFRQTPEIPMQTPGVGYIDILLHKKKHNPIDDHPYHLEHRSTH